MPSIDRTAILLRFAEPATALLPSDAAGALEDMTGDTGSSPALGLPAVVSSLFGYGRSFTTDKGLVGAEAVSGQAQITRDVTIEAVLEWDIASASIGTPCTIVAGGKPGGTGQRVLYGLALDKISATEGVLRMIWEESDGTDATAVGKGFMVPASGYLYLWAARRWVSESECEVTYGVNGVYLGAETVVEGDIGGQTAIEVTVGCIEDGASDYEDFFFGTIDQIRVSNEVRSPEECRQIYRDFAVYQPRGYELIKAVQPASDAYSIDPDSGIQREFQVEGDGIGQLMAKGAELREDFAPKSAWSMLEDWERICKLPPKPLDSIEVRRNRVLSYLRKVHGYSPAQIKDALTAVFDLDAADIEILEYENLYEDAFATAIADYWTTVAPAGSVSIVSGEVRLELNSAADGRWLARDASKGPTAIRMHIDGDLRDSDPSDGVDATIKVTHNFASTFGNGNHAGIFVSNLAGDLLIFGFYKTGGTTTLGYRIFTGGALGSWTALENPAPATPQWLRLRFDGGTGYTVWYNGTGPDTVSNETAIAGISLPTVIGLMLMTDVASNPSISQCEFDDWRLFVPNGLRCFNWYAYRDSSLSGTPDMDGARRVIEKVKPAHTEASATNRHPMQCDDDLSLCDYGPAV